MLSCRSTITSSNIPRLEGVDGAMLVSASLYNPHLDDDCDGDRQDILFLQYIRCYAVTNTHSIASNQASSNATGTSYELRVTRIILSVIPTRLVEA